MKYVTQVFRNALLANPAVLNNLYLRVVLFRNSPGAIKTFDYSTVPTVKKLIDGNYPGWELTTATVPYTSQVQVTTSTAVNPTGGENAYIRFDEFHLRGLTKKVEASAIGIEVCNANGSDLTLWGEVNPLILVSDEMFPNGRVTLDKDDTLTARDDPDLKAATPTAAKWLLAWTHTTQGASSLEAATPAQRDTSITIGDLAILIGPPDYNAAHHFDAWLYPQRVNYIANPSFEAINNKYWATNGTFSRVPSLAGGFAGKFVGEQLVVESNNFPIDKNAGLWTVQMLIQGTGLLSIGLVSWDAAYDTTNCDWGDERWELSPKILLHVKSIRKCFDAAEGMLIIRVEGSGDTIIDQVICEPGVLTDWPYFDGDSQYGAPEDFSWYGTRGESYSLWYNNRRSIISRLFLQPTYSGSVSTETTPYGLAYNWVAAGTVVAHHLDVLRPDDLKTPPLAKSVVMPDTLEDPIFGVPGGTANVLTVESTLVMTTLSDEVFIANPEA